MTRHARDRVRVLEREEEALLRPLVGAGLGEVLAVEQDLALGDLVGGMAGDRVGERRLARAVRAHDRVHLVRVDREVDALDDRRSRPRARRADSSAPAVPSGVSPQPASDGPVARARQCRSIVARPPSGGSAATVHADAVCIPGRLAPRRNPLLRCGHAKHRPHGDHSVCSLLALLLFGAKRLPEIGRSLGSGMREFKDSVTGDRGTGRDLARSFRRRSRLHPHRLRRGTGPESGGRRSGTCSAPSTPERENEPSTPASA